MNEKQYKDDLLNSQLSEENILKKYPQKNLMDIRSDAVILNTLLRFGD